MNLKKIGFSALLSELFKIKYAIKNYNKMFPQIPHGVVISDYLRK